MGEKYLTRSMQTLYDDAYPERAYRLENNVQMSILPSMKRARYRFAADKAYAAIKYMVGQCADLDLHTALKACYFADKTHLNEHHQPIFGATYRAMKYGPVPLEIYEMIKGENLWLSELEVEAMAWHLEGYKIKGQQSNAPLERLSESEEEHFQEGFEKSRAMSFTARTSATHGADWQAANGGVIRYEDMIEDSEIKPDLVKYIKETARHTRL